MVGLKCRRCCLGYRPGYNDVINTICKTRQVVDTLLMDRRRTLIAASSETNSWVRCIQFVEVRSSETHMYMTGANVYTRLKTCDRNCLIQPFAAHCLGWKSVIGIGFLGTPSVDCDFLTPKYIEFKKCFEGYSM